MGQLISPAVYFFMYAFPALRPEILENQRKYGELERTFHERRAPAEQELESLFPHAFKRVRDWSVEGIREYWWWGHAELIDNRLDEYKDSPEAFRKQCKVRPAILKSLSSSFETAEVVFKGEGKIQKVLVPRYMSDLSKGDYVTVHLRRIIERIGEDDYNDF